MSKALTINSMLDKYKAQISAALPKHITPDRMARLAMTSIRRNRLLASADPVSLFGAIIEASQLGLEIGIHAHLVPFKNNKRGGIVEAQMIPDYRGLIHLARNSGNITRFKAEIVRENDMFDYSEGTEPYLRHKPALKDRGEVLGAYAIAKFADSDDYEFVFMPVEDIDRHRGRSKSANNGPWVTDYDAMAKKTVAKQLCKWLPVSVELTRAVQMDDIAEVGDSQGTRSVIDGEIDFSEEAEVEEPKTRTEQVKNTLGKKQSRPDDGFIASAEKAIADVKTQDDYDEVLDYLRDAPPEHASRLNQLLTDRKKEVGL